MAEILQTSFSPTAYYRMETLTTDSTVNGHTLTNNNSVTQIGGKYGLAADFGSANTNKKLSRSGDTYGGINGGAVAFTLWVKLDTEITSSSYGIIMLEHDNTHTRQEIVYDYNSGTIRLRFSRVRMNIASDDATYTKTLGTSNFYHLAYNYDGTTVTGYVNGSSVATVASSGSGATIGSNLFYIGANHDGNNDQYFGSIQVDDVGVFSGGLTASQIMQIYIDSSGGVLGLM